MTGHAAYPTGLRTTPTRHRALRQRMAAPGIVVAPHCYDCITARLVEVSGFDAAYVTGSGVSMSALGAPDMGALSFGEILDRVRRICESVSIPIIADADTGYGGPLNVIRNMREFERAGVSAEQFEDEPFMKVLRDVLPADGIVVDEVTQLGYIIWYGYPVDQPRRLISSGFSGTLGYGFPTALGVKVAYQLGSRHRHAVRNQPRDGGGEQCLLRQRAARPAAAVLRPPFRRGPDQPGLPTLRPFLRHRSLAGRDRRRSAWRALREPWQAMRPAVIEVISDIAKDYPPQAFHQPRLR
ncbi:MAG: isocitrate lyase/phosphoenolpyruvate mutase family protein [Burkholderiaceae bacterium]